MRPKKSKETKKYAVGGFVAGAALGGLQSLLGVGQMIAGQSAASRIKEASTARPSEYAELLKQARNAELEQKRLEELNRSIATGIAAAQQAGGRAVIGALPGMTRTADVGAIDILGQRQAQTVDALQFGAQGAEREIGRKINREMMERGAAQAAIEGGLQNFAGGLGQIGSAAVLGLKGKEKQGEEPTAPKLPGAGRLKKSTMGGDFGSPEAGLFPEELINTELFAEKGAMVTGGKFDHKTNPIDIIQQGRKIGEMTGGEVILNPAQQKKLSKESAYFRQLLKKFNKQK
jgi:hypothetical protein